MSTPDGAPPSGPTDTSWTGATRRFLERRLPLAHLLPSRQPFFVGSWVYVFGVVAVTGLIWVIGSGIVLAFFGPGWWHVSGVGRFVNSVHFWSVQLFFVFAALHLWGQYFMASWRNGRATTWLVGVVIFIVGLVTGFTGYVSQQNLDAQWIALNAKDGINATGTGAFFNVLDFGQMYGIHVMLLPVLVTMLVVLHVVQVRMRGVVKPIQPRLPAASGDRPTDVAS
ncbi:MAG: cytochrome b N-terminal domain-containing protein [Candidatus Limnocylindrales bacterium]